MSKGNDLDVFEKDIDFDIKRVMFNDIFSTNYKTYDEMSKHKFRDFSSPGNVSRSAIANEPGRTLGFLHEYVEGKKRLEKQVAAMVETKPVTAICLRDDTVINNMSASRVNVDVKQM